MLVLPVDNQIRLVYLLLEGDALADGLPLRLGLAVLDRRGESRQRVGRDHQPNTARAAAAEDEQRLDHSKDLEEPSTANQVKLVLHLFPQDWHVGVLL